MPLACAGWDDLPGELHFEILRLVPLCDATAARQVSREMRDKVDETWRAWGIRATADELVSANYPANWRMREAELECGPLAVFRFDGSHRHHLMCLGLKWQAQLVAWEEQEVDINRSLWFDEECEDFSLLLVAVRARRPAERGADGAVEWEYVLRDEVVKVVKAALEKSGAEEYMKEHWYCNMGVDWHRRDMRPLLSQCAMRGCLGAVKACLDAGAQVDADSPSNLRYWMDGDPPEEPSSRLSRGDIFDFTMYWPALVLAARAGHETVVEALLEAGASAQIGWHGEDWTFPAVCGGQPTAGILRPLAEAGADVDAVPSYPEWCRFEMPAQYPTALMIAARDKRLDMAQTLVELGADVNDVACCGHTVMHMAADGEVVRWLAARGGEVSGDSFDGWPPLQSACGGGRVDAARALIELGAEVDGDSLMWAVGVRDEENAVEITRMLLAAGANPEGYGLQPQHAIRHPGCVDLLVEAGADLEALDCFEKTPIYSAVKHLLREEELVAPDKRHDWGAVVLRLADLGADLINTGGEPGLVKRKVEELRRQRAAECGGDSCAAD